jgi:cytochrome c-type biogenesis protein CcmF
VHAFATDPARGLFILVFLLLVVGGSLTLYALRAPTVSSRVSFGWCSRESLLVLNNVVFLVATFTVLFGTLFPLLMDALGQGKYSVGPPYFNAVFVPLMAVLIPFMAPGAISRWKNDTIARWKSELLVPLLVALACGLILPFMHDSPYNIPVALAVVLATWLLLGMLKDLANRVRNASSLGRGLRRLTPSYWGMFVAHIGFAMSVVGVVVTSQYAIERDLKMVPGDVETLSGFEFRLLEVTPVKGPNYTANEARFEVSREGRPVASLAPQKRRYLATGSVMTEAAIDAGFFRDLYVAMGEPIGQDGAWAIRLHYKPFIRWVWLGAVLMGLGGFVTVADKRYRRRRVAVESGTAGELAVGR